MFIDITDPQSPLYCATLLQPYARGNASKPFTAEAGLKILSHTNAPVIIKRLLDIIERAENPAIYHNLLAAMGERREQPPELAARLGNLGYPPVIYYDEKHQDDKIILSAPLCETGYAVPANAVYGTPKWENANKLLFPPEAKRFGLLGSCSAKSPQGQDGLPRNLDMSAAVSCREIYLEGLNFANHDFALPAGIEMLSVSNSPEFPGRLGFGALSGLRSLTLGTIGSLENIDFSALPPTLESFSCCLKADAQSPCPKRLDLSNCPKLKKLVLKNIDFNRCSQLRLPPSLEELQLLYAENMPSLAVLPPLPALKSLNLEGSAFASPTDFAARFPKLEELGLAHAIIAAQPHFPVTLQKLSLSSAKIIISGGLELNRLPSLKEANASNAKGTLIILPPQAKCIKGTSEYCNIRYFKSSARAIYESFKHKLSR